MEFDNSGEGGGGVAREDFDETDSSCSTPYYSAPSSPGRSSTASVATLPGYYYSAPTSPMHFVLSSFSNRSSYDAPDDFSATDFDFSARFTNHSGLPPVGSMSSADELFLNGQIRPMKLSTHLQTPQLLLPLLDLGEDNEEGEDNEDAEDKCVGEMVRGRELRIRSRSMHRRSRSLSPLRSSALQWQDGVDKEQLKGGQDREEDPVEMNDHVKVRDVGFQTTTTATESSASASSSRSNSSGRNGKRWIFLKDFLLYRSKSEGRGHGKDKFWQSISFSASKDKLLSTSATSTTSTTTLTSSFFSKIKDNKSKDSSSSSSSTTDPLKKRAAPGEEAAKKPTTSSVGSKPKNALGKKRIPAPSAHERHYTTNRAQAVEMRKRTYLPYRQGLLGCLGFSSKGYGAMNGFARSLNPVSSS